MWVKLWKTRQYLCVIRPHTINNNQNNFVWRLAIYLNDHKLTCSKFLRILSLDETLNGMSSNETKTRGNGLICSIIVVAPTSTQMTNHLFQICIEMSPKVMDSNERPHIKIRWKGCHKSNPYNKGDSQESNLIHKITMCELVSTPYNIIWPMSI